MATTDQALMSSLQYRLVEPPDGGANWPSQLWTREEVLASLNYRQGRLLFDTLLLVGLANLAVTAGTSRLTLPEDWIRTIDATWLGVDGTVRSLDRSSSFEADRMIPSWETTNTLYPRVYFEEETATRTLTIAPAPSVNGIVEVLYVPNGPALNGNGEILTTPDDFRHALEYGALADLLGKDGRGRDVTRAAYAESRVELAVTAANLILSGWA